MTVRQKVTTSYSENQFLMSKVEEIKEIIEEYQFSRPFLLKIEIVMIFIKIR